jgi:hypothetical protein
MGSSTLRRVATGCVTASFLLAAPSAVRGEEAWHTLGPLGTVGNEGLGGRVISLAVDPRNPNRVFAGSASGGLWVSELSDSRPGKTTAVVANPQEANWRDTSRPYWRYVDTGFPVLGVGAIAIDPQDPDVIYIGTGEVYGYQRTTARGFDNRGATRHRHPALDRRRAEVVEEPRPQAEPADRRAEPPDRARFHRSESVYGLGHYL